MSNLKEFSPLEAPFIKVEVEVTENALINGKKPKIKKIKKYKLAPSPKKIANYIVNQIFGSDIVLQAENYNINWLMPSLKEALENSIYCKEAFLYLHKFDGKIYLECIKPNNIFDLVQKFDKVYSLTLVECEEYGDEKLELHRHIQIDNGKSYIELQAYRIDKFGKQIPIPISEYNRKMGTEYLDKYILPYEVIINIDSGQDFFHDSKKLILEEMNILNVIADEVEKTRTRIATTQHYQTGNIVTKWQPNTYFNVNQVSVGKLQDYFTLMPGDRDHQLFEFLQGNVRTAEYTETFKFYDYQIIQMAGLSPATFGYEKDSYMNQANVVLSANASEMTIEAIKTQIEPQINNLLINIIKMQQTQDIKENIIPVTENSLSWDYGSNERFDDLKKIAVLRQIQGVASVPYQQKSKIIAPIIQRMLQDVEGADEVAKELQKSNKEETDSLKIEYGEI
jgi:hypothetical protein